MSVEPTTSNFLPQSGTAAERTVTMTSSLESEVREFAREFNTPNVRRAVALCEAGTLSWAQVHGIFQQSLGKGLQEVAA